ncbi:MAG: hypothetical protein U0836_21300 [Pirellulales bacterium]
MSSKGASVCPRSLWASRLELELIAADEQPPLELELTAAGSETFAFSPAT